MEMRGDKSVFEVNEFYDAWLFFSRRGEMRRKGRMKRSLLYYSFLGDWKIGVSGNNVYTRKFAGIVP